MPIILPPPKFEVKIVRGRHSPSLSGLMTAPSLSPAMSGRLYPSGCFTIGYVPRKEVSAKDLTYEAECGTWDLIETVQHNRIGGTKKRFYVKSRDLPRFIDSSYLGKARKSRGSKGLTRHGKRYVREACFLLEREYGVKRLGFYTLTIPSCTAVDLYEVAIHWTSIQKYFFKLLRGEMYEAGIREFHYVGVTENQVKRSLSESAPCWHLHFIMPCYHPGTVRFIVSSDTIRRLWKRAIANYVPSFEDANFRASADTAILRKSASGYISKYFSKGSDLEFLHPSTLPSSWYYSSREMKSWYKSLLTPLSSEKCLQIIDVLSHSSFVLFWGFVTTPDPISLKETIRGYYGKCTELMSNYLST